LYITITVVFLTAFSTRVSLLSSKIHNGDDTPKECDALFTYNFAISEPLKAQPSTDSIAL